MKNPLNEQWPVRFGGRPIGRLAAVLFLLSAVLLPLTACANGNLACHPVSSAMVIDGAWTDWEGIPVHQVEEMNGLVVGLANDGDALYLMARSTDQRLVRSLRMRGIVVQASGQGKGGTDCLIRYHGSVALADGLPPPGAGPGGGRMPTLLETGEDSGLPVPGMIEIEQGEVVATVAESRPDGLAAGSAAVGDVYCYEFRLPLDTLFADSEPDVSPQGRKIQLEVKVGKMTSEMRRQMILMGGPGGRGGRGGGRGGMGGGRGAPDGMHGSGGRRSEPRTLRVTIELR